MSLLLDKTGHVVRIQRNREDGLQINPHDFLLYSIDADRLPNGWVFANVQAMRLKAVLNCKCPHCLQGAVFSRFLKMYENCPVCGIEYEREHGFFMMAIFIGYILGFIAVIPVMIALFLLDAPIVAYFVVSAVILIPLSPFIFRYSRVIWLHLDELMDPRPATPQK